MDDILDSILNSCDKRFHVNNSTYVIGINPYTVRLLKNYNFMRDADGQHPSGNINNGFLIKVCDTYKLRDIIAHIHDNKVFVDGFKMSGLCLYQNSDVYELKLLTSLCTRRYITICDDSETIWFSSESRFNEYIGGR